jgi:ribosome-associated protein
MNTHFLPEKIEQCLLDKKFSDISMIDVIGVSSIADYFIIATGHSNRQLLAGAQYLKDEFRPIYHGIEGNQYCDWVLVDIGNVIVHFFKPEARAFYQIEEYWSKNAQKKKMQDSSIFK